MSLLRNLTSGLRALFHKEQVERGVDEELRGHLDAPVKGKMRSGMRHEEALRAAWVRMGSVEAVKEETRSAGWEATLETLWQDVRCGARMLGRSRGLTVILVITLALGIGVNTAIFSVMNGWLLRPLPVRAPDQIMVLAFQPRDGHESAFSYPDLQDFRTQADTFFDVFAYKLGGAGLSVDGVASEFAYSAVTSNYFSALGVKPLLGRLLLPGEGEKPGEELLVVLGYSFWQKRFGAMPASSASGFLSMGNPPRLSASRQRSFWAHFLLLIWMPICLSMRYRCSPRMRAGSGPTATTEN